MYPAVCNMGVEKCVADCPTTLSDAEQKRGLKRSTSSKEDEIHQPRVKKAQRDKPKGRKVYRRYVSTL